MRLALFTDTFAPQLNGVTRTLDRLVAEAESRGDEVRVFTTDDPRADRTRRSSIRRSGSIACPLYPELRMALPSAAGFARALVEFRPALVHLATPFGVGLAGRRAARLAGVPWVSSYHTSFSAYARYYRLGGLAAPGWRFLRWFHNGGRRTFCPTAAVRRELQDHGFRRLALWGRGVDTARFDPTHRSRAIRLRLGVSEDTIVVAYVGRIAREKGLDSLLGAMACLRQLRSDVVFAFAGEGPYLEHCRRAAPGQALFLGPLQGEALSAFYASADMVVFPSSTDTFGNVLVEAMASGVPVVAADCATSREVLGVTGVFHAPDSAAQLANAILDLVVNVPRRRALGRIARLRAGQFSWRSVFDELFAEYEAVVAGRESVRSTSAPALGRSHYAPHASG